MLKTIKFIFSDIAISFRFKLAYLKHNIKGARVQPSCRVSLNATLEKETGFYGNTRITGGVSIGMFTYATDSIIQNATIGKFCSIAPGVKIGLNEHPLDGVLLHPKGYDSSSFNSSIPPVVIGNDVWICANSVILSGVQIGDGAVIAAGAVVNKNVEAFSIVGGVPAKVIGSREKTPLFDKILRCKSSEEVHNLILSQKASQNLPQVMT